MKTALLSLVIAISVAIMSVLQFDRYQKFTHTTLSNLSELNKKTNTTLGAFQKDVEIIKEQELHLRKQVQDTFWKISAAEYLVSMADAHLQVEKNIPAAIQLLTLALDQINSMQDPKLVALQQALAADLTALKSLSLPQVNALWLTVSEIIEKTKTLAPRHATLSAVKKETLAVINPAKATNSWKEKLLQSFEEIKDLVKIRRYAKPIEPLLTETQQSMVQENLRSLLEQTRLGILTGQEGLYKKAIQETEDWITSYYETNNETVKSIQDSLKALSAVSLQVELPPLTSLQQFGSIRQ